MEKKLNYEVTEMTYDSKSMLDETNFYHQKQGKPSQLTNTLTYILGDYNKNYPISTMTLGNQNKNAAKELEDVQFLYPVMGRDDKPAVVAFNEYGAGDKPGSGHNLFNLYLQDNWIKRFMTIESANGVQAYVHEDPVQQPGGYWKYRIQLDPADADDYCPVAELDAGTLWTGMFANVAESESRGTDSNHVAPGSWKNQMGFLRCSTSWAGNSANKVMNIEMQTEKGKTSSWMDFDMWQFEKKCLREYENFYWYSRYNRQVDGSIALKDLTTGKVIPKGSGMLEQIQNKSTFATLSYNSLQNKIGSALFGMGDADGMSITLYTGRGGMRDFDAAMKAQGAEILTDFTGVADKFVHGTSRDLIMDGFFTSMYHIDGYYIKVKHNPLFDYGAVALKSPRHPISGFPLESHRLVFIDDNDVNGEPNIQHVAQKGRSYLHGVVNGLTPMPKSLRIAGGTNVSADALPNLSHETDKSSYHRFKSGGIQLLRGNKCFDWRCVAGL